MGSAALSQLAFPTKQTREKKPNQTQELKVNDNHDGDEDSEEEEKQEQKQEKVQFKGTKRTN